MDFIEQLPKSSSYTAILVVVDSLMKQAIFIPTHDTITSADLAKLFVLHVFSKHGVPVEAYAYMHKVNPNIFPHFLSFYLCITILSLFAHHPNFFWIFPHFSSHSIHTKSLSLWHSILDFASV